MSLTKEYKLFSYNPTDFSEGLLQDDLLVKPEHSDNIQWLNVYGFDAREEIKKIVTANNFDEFLNVLLKEEEQRNKLVDMDHAMYVTTNIMIYKDDEFDYDKIRFYFEGNTVFTIQEKEGDYFEEVRDLIRLNKGIIRKRAADYLLFRMLEAILENYEKAYDQFLSKQSDLGDINEVKPNPDYVLKIEERKQHLVTFRSSLLSLKELLNRLNNIEKEGFGNHYFGFLKDSASFIIEELDAQLQELDSRLNLIFNIQSHRLNEVMKTLTIFSVIFIPLTFLAGIYGMNFKNIPETKTDYGYFVLIGVMLLVAITTIIYFKRKKWF